MNFVEELRWRGMIHDFMPGTETLLESKPISGYIGFDPTSDSLHIGSLVQIMTLVHFQRAGHKPFALVGGATGMVGDPSGKSAERNLLDTETLNRNVEGIKNQLMRFLDFDSGDTSAEMVNNYDWFENMNFLDFIRDVGKHITVNYMMAKESVKLRLETGISFTEFSYQLVQGYDYFWLFKHKNCKIQMGGSDQWGNILTGTELIRRKDGGEAFGLTTPLIKKADGTKFGKTEGGNIWLDKNRTSVRDFYQYWLNASDEDASNYIRIFTLFSKTEIENLEKEHGKDPGKKLLQKNLAKDITVRVHGEQEFAALGLDNNIMFDKNIGKTELAAMDENAFTAAVQSFHQIELDSPFDLSEINLLDFLTTATGNRIYPSKSEATRALDQNAVAINKVKISKNYELGNHDLLHQKFIIVSKGKKTHFVVMC